MSGSTEHLDLVLRRFELLSRLSLRYLRTLQGEIWIRCGRALTLRANRRVLELEVALLREDGHQLRVARLLGLDNPNEILRVAVHTGTQHAQHGTSARLRLGSLLLLLLERVVRRNTDVTRSSVRQKWPTERVVHHVAQQLLLIKAP